MTRVAATKRSLFGGMATFLLVGSMTASGEGVLALTAGNFESAVDGKNIFVQFLNEECDACVEMKEDWEALGREFQGDDLVLIATVNCASDESQALCQDFDVQSFPTILYGDPMSAETYNGMRNYKELSQFAKTELSKPICGLYRLDSCTEEERAVIEGFQQTSPTELEQMAAQVESKVKAQQAKYSVKVNEIEERYNDLVAELNKKYQGLYDDLAMEFQDVLTDIKAEHNYKFMEQILDLRDQEAAAKNNKSSDSSSSSDEL